MKKETREKVGLTLIKIGTVGMAIATIGFWVKQWIN